MFGDYIDILAKSCKSTFQSMTNAKVSKVLIRQDNQQPPEFSIGHVISFKDSDKNLTGDLIVGFGELPMAVFAASVFAEKINLPPVEKMDETASDILNEFMNIVAGTAMSEWKKAGFSVQFERPVMVQNKDFGNSVNSDSEMYQITMELKNGLSSQSRAFDHVSLRVSCLTGAQDTPKEPEGKRILVAEDSGIMSKILSAALKESGFVVEQANDGQEAIAKHKKFHPDLTIMDLYMPNVDGLEAIVQIRESDPDARFIVLTSSTQKDEIVTAKTLNVVDYVLKTGEMEDIIAKVKKALI